MSIRVQFAQGMSLVLSQVLALALALALPLANTRCAIFNAVARIAHQNGSVSPLWMAARPSR